MKPGLQKELPSNQEFKYWAFISYSHADEEWAKWLHKSIETYRVPREVVRRKTPQGEIPKRLFPVFRDREELPGASDLGGQLQDALTRSRSLIVVCSPKSAVSKWVNEEVKTYKKFGHGDRVFCLITDGEPNAAPDSGLLECFPPAVRFQVHVDGTVTKEPAEPIAADARPGKDGKSGALLKLLSGVMGVGYDELRQRQRQRQRRRRMQEVAIGGVIMLLIGVLYVVVADAGLNLPLGDRIRTILDRNEASVLRPARSNEEIRNAARVIRTELLQALKGGQTPKGGIVSNLSPGGKGTFEYWSNAQALTAVFSTHELSENEARQLLKGFEEQFESGSTIEAQGTKYGWVAHPKEQRTQAEPAIWTVAALARALGRPELLTGDVRERAVSQLHYAQEVLKTYRPTDDGGWNMFPSQEEPALHNVYTTALALLALLETRRANLGWEGSVEKRDQLIKATAQWLVSHYDDKANSPGWRTASEMGTATIDGLTLQIYGELLRAEAEAGFVLPPRIANQITDYLAKCVDRQLDFPSDSGEFSAFFTDHRGQQYVAREALGFLWYPWAIRAAQLWLLRAEKHGAPKEDHVRVRRALGHLVNELGPQVARKYESEWTFQAAETLYGLSTIPPK